MRRFPAMLLKARGPGGAAVSMHTGKSTHRDVLNYHGPPPGRDPHNDPQAWEYLRDIAAMAVTACAMAALLLLSFGMASYMK